MDQRKNNKGTIGNKGGRPPKADEIKIIEAMDAIAAPAKVWEALFRKVEEGDTQAIKTWLNYRFGMPKQTIDQNNTHVFEDFDVKKLVRFDNPK